MARKSCRGLVLISALGLLILVFLLVLAALNVSEGSLSSMAHFSERTLAEEAARAGLEYARVRLQEDPTWRGGGAGPTQVVDMPDLSVWEDRGNVVGLVRTPGGEVGQFRLRFNYQDGAGGEDDLDDPSADFRIDHPYVSVNNLSSGNPVDVPRADGPGYSVTDSSERPYQVPEYTACVIVEGRAGPGLSTLTSNRPNAAPGAARVSTRVVEAYLRSDFSDRVDAAVMAASDLEVQLESGGKVEVKSKDDAVPPRVRSKGDTAVSGGSNPNYVSDKGEVRTRTGTLDARYDPEKVEVRREGASDPFYRLKWEDVKKADSSPATTTAVHLRAGTYVVWDDGTLRYYPLDYEDYVKWMEARPADDADRAARQGLILSSNLKEVRLNLAGVPDPADAKPLVEYERKMTGGSVKEANLIVRNDIYVRPESEVPPYAPAGAHSARGFAFVPGAGAAEGPPPASLELGDLPGSIAPQGAPPGGSLGAEDLRFRFKPGWGRQVHFSTDGDFRVGGSLQGKGGSITAGGDLTVIGGGIDLSALPPSEGEQGINMYARGDVTLNSFAKKKLLEGEFQDFKLRGVVYTWGDFQAVLGPWYDIHPDYDLKKWGMFDLQGSLVAYGADPNDPAGSAGKGKVSLRAKEVKVEFDSAYVAGLQFSGSRKLTRTLWNWW